ncbi:MAG TPA: hypothetical protein VLA01_01805 [Nitrosopumilaceae archaeon]|nr:hypothetical protein [Nitrosopumilaceae archaeon]
MIKWILFAGYGLIISGFINLLMSGFQFSGDSRFLDLSVTGSGLLITGTVLVIIGFVMKRKQTDSG